MNDPIIPAVGIDLGTTFSVVARIDDQGRPVTIVNAEGDRLTPSDVLFDGEEVVVGKEAQKALATEADHVAECSKRDVGRPLYHKTIGGKQYPPQVIEAFVLHKLRTDAARQIGPFGSVVITVPAYFDESRRKATQDAGYIAGFEVLDIINEPTAAAVAFGFQRGYLDPQGSSLAPQHVLVYDLGGGTFDVTVMQIRGTEFNALATDGDVRLGGYDWDMRLIEPRGRTLRRRAVASTRATIRWRPAELRLACEDAKRTLSARQKAAVTCDCRGTTARIEIARQQFEQATADLLDRTRFTTVQALRAAGLDWTELDRVLLVGGSTRMPMVREMLRQLAGKEPDDSVAADEAVAHGAALHASLILGRQQGQPPRFKIRNVNSHSLGVVGIDPQNPAPPQRHPGSAKHPPADHQQAGLSHEDRPASDRSASISSRAKAPRRRTARRSATARSAICRPTCRPARRSKSSSVTSPTAGWASGWPCRGPGAKWPPRSCG